MTAQPPAPNSAAAIRIAGPAGALEALYRPGTTERAALLCHPHPLYGGTMHNRVLFQLEKLLAATGRATLRFNFRGTGASEGAHDGGRGELEDARAAADELLRRSPGVTLDVVGYSFGCFVAWRALGNDPRTRTLTGIGVALRIIDFSFARTIDTPMTILQGEEDEYGSGDEIRAFAASFPHPPRLVIVPGADHLFTRGYDRLLTALPEVVAGL